MKRLALFAVAALMMPTQADGQQMESTEGIPAVRSPIEARADEVVALVNGEIVPDAVFSPDFLAAIPAAQIRTLNASLIAQIGPAIEVIFLETRDRYRGSFEIRFERGIARGKIGITPAGGHRIDFLQFTSIDTLTLSDDTAEKISAELLALPGMANASFGPLDGGAPLISVARDMSLALGSTFKLYVLAALAEDIGAGKQKWSDVVPLTERSYPSGQLHEWPMGAPLTLHTMASLMISISDNTATDQLIAVLGRDRLVTLMRESGHANPAANIPFLTTRELFMLKDCEAACIDAWRSGDAAVRMALLEGLDQATATLDEINENFVDGPRALDIEWFASPADLTKLLAHMRRTADPLAFEIMAINEAAPFATKAKWSYIGYKGGSEPGVLNLTWLLRDKAGRDHILTLGWNNPKAALDEGRLDAIAQRILLLPH